MISALHLFVPALLLLFTFSLQSSYSLSPEPYQISNRNEESKHFATFFGPAPSSSPIRWDNTIGRYNFGLGKRTLDIIHDPLRYQDHDLSANPLSGSLDIGGHSRTAFEHNRLDIIGTENNGHNEDVDNNINDLKTNGMKDGSKDFLPNISDRYYDMPPEEAEVGAGKNEEEDSLRYKNNRPEKIVADTTIGEDSSNDSVVGDWNFELFEYKPLEDFDEDEGKNSKRNIDSMIKLKRDRYGFGLGKRYGSNYMGDYMKRRYNFGLGKRQTPKVDRYGKRQNGRYSFGLGKREPEGLFDEGDDDRNSKDGYDHGNIDGSVILPLPSSPTSPSPLLLPSSRPPPTPPPSPLSSLTLSLDEVKRENYGQRYNFGLGKRLEIGQRYNFGLGRRFDDSRRYNFGLGKRAAPSGSSSGTSVGSGGGQRYNFGLGKREAPSIGVGQRYNFGLGKRLPLVYPDSEKRYNFGLGKRAETLRGGQRYNFGLGRKRTEIGLQRYNFGLGKRELGRQRYSFGLGKRSDLH